MSENVLEYKGYYAKIEYSTKDQVLFGKIEGIRDLVNFESASATGIEKEFHLAVDDYLAFCEEIGQKPEKPYKGVFNVRISPELHRAAAIAADKKGETLNAFVAEAIDEAVNGKTSTVIYSASDALVRYQTIVTTHRTGTGAYVSN